MEYMQFLHLRQAPWDRFSATLDALELKADPRPDTKANTIVGPAPLDEEQENIDAAHEASFDRAVAQTAH
jgi:hypothetical protein